MICTIARYGIIKLGVFQRGGRKNVPSREAQKIAVEFEQKIQQGFLIDNKQTFAEYATYVIDLKREDWR